MNRVMITRLSRTLTIPSFKFKPTLKSGLPTIKLLDKDSQSKPEGLSDLQTIVRYEQSQPIIYSQAGQDSQEAVEKAVKICQSLKCNEINVELEKGVEGRAKSLLLALSRKAYQKHWKEDQGDSKFETTFHLAGDVPDLSYIEALANCSSFSRTIASLRSNMCFPKTFIQIAKQQLQGLPVETKVLDFPALKEQKMGLFVAVGQGSIHQPCMINLTYRGKPDQSDTVAIVGKGLTFDTGGYNIKPLEGMKGMFLDKHGAASMLAAFKTVCQLKLPVNLTCSLGMAENCISGKAYKTTDIFHSKKGLSVEVGHTDAEGRLVLADTMTWTQENHKVSTMLEMSTLTGAIIIALGNQTAGLFSNSDDLSQQLISAGKNVDEAYFRMPILKEHRNIIKSKCADITNSPGKPAGASSQAAAFLEKFVEKDVKWCHVDMAGTMGKEEGTGFGAMTVVEWLKGQ